MAEYKGIAKMRQKLRKKRTRVLTRYSFYEMKNITRDFNISTPPDLKNWQSVLGWCGKAVDSLGDRLVFREFENDNFGLMDIYDMNNKDVLFDSAINGALIASCDFVYISPDETGYPRMQVIDGSNATGDMDPITGLLKEGYAVLERDKNKNPKLEAWFIPGHIYIIDPTGKKPVQDIKNNAPYPLLVPIVFRPDEMRPFGHSRISRSCMSLVGSALRTIKRSEISAEFYSFPQKYVNGLAEDHEKIEKWQSALSAMLTFEKDDDGDSPQIGQFQQQSMQPHLDQLKMFASLFAGETGLTMDDIGFPTENPSNSEAIKAAHETLRLTARKAQRTFGRGFLNAGYLAACVRDDFPYQRSAFYETVPKWSPLFEPDASQLGAIGDAVYKINEAVPGYIDDNKIKDMFGI